MCRAAVLFSEQCRMVFLKAVHDGRNQRFTNEPRFVAHAVAGNVALQGFFFFVVQHEGVRVRPVGCCGFRGLFPWLAHGFSIFICSNGAGNVSVWSHSLLRVLF